MGYPRRPNNGRLKQDDIDLIANMMDGMLEVKLEEKLKPVRERLDRLDGWTAAATKQFKAMGKLMDLTSKRLDGIEARLDKVGETLKVVADYVSATERYMNATDERIDRLEGTAS